MKLKKGDTVEALSGKDRGKRGKILEVFPKEMKVLVDGVNTVKRHTKPMPPKVPQGGILEKAKPVHAGKVMLVCPSCNESTRVAVKISGKERKRACKECKKEIA